MAKYLDRLLGRTVEEAMVVQAKICRIRGSTREPVFKNLVFEWKRGDTIESSAPFGEIAGGQLDMHLAIIFNKLSICFRQSEGQRSVYQEKMSQISIYAQTPAKQNTLLGTAEFELSQYVNKIRQDVELRLTGGPLMNGSIEL